MDSVLRAAAMYVALMVLFKIAGRRSLAELTTFDFILLMIIGEATQQALLGDDFSLTNSMLVIVTLIAIDVGFSLLKQRSGWVSRGASSCRHPRMPAACSCGSGSRKPTARAPRLRPWRHRARSYPRAAT